MSGGALALAGKVSSAGFGFFSSIVAARYLGTDGFGLYSLSFGIVTFLGLLGGGGIKFALLARLPERFSISASSAHGTLSSAFYYILCISIGVTASLLLLSDNISLWLNQPHLYGFLWVMALSIPFASIIEAMRSASQSVYAFASSIVPLFIIQPALLLVGLLIVTSLGLHGNAVAWVYAAAVITASLISVVLIVRRREYGVQWLRKSNQWDLSVLRQSLPFLWIQLFHNLKKSILIFIMGYSLTASQVGLYSASWRIAHLVSFILVAVNEVFTPMISALWASRDRDEIGNVYKMTTKWTLAISLPLCLWLVFSAPGILMIFGPEYRMGTAVLVLLAIGYLVNSSTGCVEFLMLMTGHAKLMSWNTIGFTFASALLGIMAAPLFGILGVAVVEAGLMILFNFVMVLQVWKSLRISPYDRRVVGVLAAGAAALVAGICTYPIAWHGSLSLTLGLALISISVLGTYGAAFGLLGFSPSDRVFLVQMINRARSGIMSARSK